MLAQSKEEIPDPCNERGLAKFGRQAQGTEAGVLWHTKPE